MVSFGDAYLLVLFPFFPAFLPVPFTHQQVTPPTYVTSPADQFGKKVIDDDDCWLLLLWWSLIGGQIVVVISGGKSSVVFWW